MTVVNVFQNKNLTCFLLFEGKETTAPAAKEEPLLAGKTPEEQAELLKQLTQVQKQIEALQALPSTIQATLDALSSQLCQLLQPPKEPTPPVEPAQPQEIAGNS